MRTWKSFFTLGVFVTMAWTLFMGAPVHASPQVIPPLKNSVVTPVSSFGVFWDDKDVTVFDVYDIRCGEGDGEDGGGLIPHWPDIGDAINIGGDIASSVSDPGGLLQDMIICPMISAMFKGVQTFMNIAINSQLDVKPLLYQGHVPVANEPNSGIHASWRAFRDFANVILVIGVMLVVFSQATSYGLNAYGIKKLLPKIVIAAILINLSYFICAVLIDVFNILGTSVGQTLGAAINRSMAASDTSITEQMNNSTGYVAAVLMLNPATMVAFGLVMLLVLIIGIFAIFFLQARLVMIAFLVVIAPIAFAAWLLPNTEKHFKNWWSVLIKLLAIYPIVSILSVISYILIAAVGSII